MKAGPSESGFFRFMEFDPAHMRRARGFYVPMFEGAARVLDLACGRGEFLDVLREAGGRGVGVDIEAGMVELARAAGHEVDLGDAFEYLKAHEADFDGVFSAHFIEHLPYERTAELVRLCRRALRPGGILVICTPNPASLPTLQRQFWWDATHVRMYDVDLLRYTLAEAGFEAVEGGPNPENMPGMPIDVEALKVPDIGPLGRLGALARRLRLDALDRRTQVTHHHLKVVADTLAGLARELYTSSEVYVRGTRK